MVLERSHLPSRMKHLENERGKNLSSINGIGLLPCFLGVSGSCSDIAVGYFFPYQNWRINQLGSNGCVG